MMGALDISQNNVHQMINIQPSLPPSLGNLLFSWASGSCLEPVLLDTTLHMFFSDTIPGEALTARVLTLTCFFATE